MVIEVAMYCLPLFLESNAFLNQAKKNCNHETTLTLGSIKGCKK